MPVAEIPGFYYDPEKRKYFKIQKNHTVPTGSPYSAETVKKRKIQEVKSKEREKLRILKQHAVKRSSALQTGIGGTTLQGELNGCSPPGRLRARVQSRPAAYVQAWETRKFFSYKANPTVSNVEITAFDVDPKYGTLAYGWNNCLTLATRNHSHYKKKQQWIFPHNGHNRDYGLSRINHILIHPSQRLRLTTWQAPEHQHNVSVELISPSDFMSDPDGFPTVGGRVPRAPMHVRLETRDATGTRCLIRSACVAPQGASHSFFVGGESGLAAFKATESDVRVYNCVEPDARSLGATGHRDDWHFAVDAPEYSNHLVLSGSRRGGVMMYDVRVKPARHRYLLQHSSSIARIRSMGEYNIVVAGLEHTLSIYDRRHLKTSRGLPTGKAPTIPYLDLHNHRNEYDHDMDMAVDSSMHLIAAAQAGDDENIVRIWDSKSGDCVRTLSVKEGWEKDMNGSYKKASQVRFCDLSGSGGPKSLLVAKGTDIMEYGL